MSHKKRAATALKSMGAAGLAAATIVSGLSFSPAPAAAAQNAIHAGQIQLILKGESGYVYLSGNADTAGKTTSSLVTAQKNAYWWDVVPGSNGFVLYTSNNAGSCPSVKSGVLVWWTSSCAGFTYRDGQLKVNGSGMGAVRTTNNGWTGIGIGNGNYEYVGDTGPITSTVALSAGVSKVNNIAKSAVVSGTATPGAKVSIGSQEVEADKTSGAWSITVPGLSVGANELTAIQKIGGNEHDRKTVTATIVEGGLIGAVEGPDTELEKGADTEVNSIIRYRGSAATTSGEVSYTAPEGTTFAEGQATVLGDFKAPGGAWVVGSGYARLANGSLSADKKTVSFTYSYATDTARQYVEGTELRFPIKVTTPEDAVGGTSNMTGVYTGSTKQSGLESTFRAEATTKTTIETAAVELDATVDVVNNIAKTAVVSGTATPGAMVSIGSQEVEADMETGAWTITVTGLEVGENELTVVQTIGGTKHDEKTVTATIVEGGTLVGVDQGPVTLERGERTQVPFVVENREFRTGTKATVTLTAPENTSFDGQSTVQGSWRAVGATNWSGSSSIPLTNGTVEDEGKTLTFDVDWNNDRPVNQQYRYLINVTADQDAPAGSGAMEFTMPGTSSKGDFKAEGKTTTTIETAEVALDAKVESIDHAAKTAVVSGTATPGATVSIGEQSVDADAETGAWSITVRDLDEGPNELTVTQKIGDKTIDTKDLTVTINSAAISGQDGAPVTLERDGDTSVEALFKTNGSISRPQGTVEFTAPEGTTFAAGQNTINGSFKKPGEGWTNSAMTLSNGVRSVDGTKYTYDFRTTTSTWHLPADSLMRWNITVNTPANAEAGTGSMRTTLVGAAVEGSFNTTSTTATTIETAGPAAPSADGFFDADVEAWAGIRGKGAANATIVVTNAAGDQIATTTANGSGDYTVRIDPNKVGFGEQELTVAQTVNEATSDGIDVTLDYGQNDPKFTSPIEGGSLPNKDFTLTGTGNTGGKIRVNGVDLRNDDEASIGSADVTDGEWSVTNTDVTLPNGPYQFWANQRTKGGKIVFTGLNVTMEQAKPATPSAEGFFDADVEAWAGIRGKGAANATIVVTNAAGDQIATTTANGSGDYTVRIDPNKVGFGEQELTVAQTVNEATSDGIDVTLDYGQNDPKFTSPIEGGSLPNKDFTLTGTGNTGGKIRVNGVDLRNDDEASIGSADVTDGEWSVTNTDVTLPNGPYQFWANQRTKGGKIVFTGLNVTMEQAKPATPSADGYFPEDIAQWAGIRGRGTVGATVTAKNTAGDTIAEMRIVNADGTYNMAIDPSKVGDGVQTLTVTQTLNGAASDGINVALDYGFNTPRFTSPADSSVVPNRNLTLAGTGNTGGRLQVNGVDLGTDDAARIGETTVTNNAWTITNNEITLPTGFYQLWANQRTKGGKISFTGLNIQTVQAAPAAPTAVAFFGPTVETWGAISGIGEVGAEIIVRNADGDVVVRETITDPRGTYNVGIDPNKVGWGEQDFTVTQTVGGVPSAGIVVSLDYGQQSTPTITSPTFGQQIPGTSQLEFTGTGTDGSKIVVTGTDFSNDSAFGDTTVTDGTWRITSTLDLPAGNYQFWVGERSQGGKNVLTTVDVTITD